MSKNVIFKPDGDLMSQLSNLKSNTAKLWWKEYLDYHKGVDQGITYVIGYFPTKHRDMLKKAFV